MPVNTVFSWFIRKRLHQIALFRKYPEEVQAEVLPCTTSRRCPARALEREHGGIASDGPLPLPTGRRFPLRDYNGLKPWVEAAREGEPENVTVAGGRASWHAKSSGTTTDRSKFIPVTEDALEKCHYKGRQGPARPCMSMPCPKPGSTEGAT